ncbi:MAG: hypothetical protein LBV74_21335 [Tannerella sp.]|jgi:hypothetical protein|nr:hypothetical protein [Tannerella sp.]
MLKPFTYQPFTIEEEIMHHLMLQSFSLKRNGLLYGKLGIAIAFFEWGRRCNNRVYTDFATELNKDLPARIDERVTCDFATGLCGFGWGVEYMVQQRFADCNRICEEIDQRVMAVDIRRMNNFSLESGLEGFLHYILIRLAGTGSQNKNVMPFDDLYLKDTYNRLQSLPEELISNNLHRLKQAFISCMDAGSSDYKPDICSFTNDLELNGKEDILSAKPGLADGLAGKIIRMVHHLSGHKYGLS